ncbi:DUF5723 family protein [Robertkochia aurantiaca]|uniref:DUF5723 family protein n=1 Tax=Robertkochia aurantiaca TaxID=2873700 RepID=UPI001CCC9693|nr:DUF5723 family protein [Robertkochia sp. 3YJGBD-33]
MIKSCAITLTSLFLWVGSYAQNKQLLYNFREIPQSLLVNPGGKVLQKGFLGFPLLSGVYVQSGTSGFTVYDIFADDGRDFTQKVEEVIYRLNSSDVIEVNQQLELIYLGFRPEDYRSNRFYSMGIYQELNAYNYFPQDIALLAYEGNAGNVNRVYDLGHLNAQGEVLTTFHFGINFKESEDFSWGFRGKFYSSMINFSTANNKGDFVSVPGENNIYSHNVVADMALRTSGYASIRDDSPGTGRLLSRALFSGNYGLGLDLGLTYTPTEAWTYTASIQDIGMILHTTDIESYRLNGAYQLEGIEFEFGEATDDDFLDDYWEQIKEDLEEQLPLDTISQNYVSWRPVKFNAAMMHNFGNMLYRKKKCGCKIEDTGYENSVGVQLYAIKRPRGINTALTAFYYRRVFDFLRMKLSYTADKYTKTNLGLGVSTHFSNFNFYLLADNFLEYGNISDANYASVQLGLNFILPDRSYR